MVVARRCWEEKLVVVREYGGSRVTGARLMLLCGTGRAWCSVGVAGSGARSGGGGAMWVDDGDKLKGNGRHEGGKGL